MAPATITIDVDPTLDLGPLHLAWHGLMIAVGILVGTLVAARVARRRGLDPERVMSAALVMALAGILGARLLYLLLNDAAALGRPHDWFGTNGYALYGAVVLGPVAAALYLGRDRPLRYLDALAYGFPFGLAVGRIGDVINGEHHGPTTTLPWGLRHPNPEALVPSHTLAYHDGGLYELVLGVVLAVVVIALRDRLRRPGLLLWTVLALYGAGRFVMFFYRSDTESTGLGLNQAQLISVGLVAAAVGLAMLSARGARRRAPRAQLNRPSRRPV